MNIYNSNKGSILLDYLVGLFLIGMIVHIELLLMMQLTIDTHFDWIQDEIMIYKLNQQLMVSKVSSCSIQSIEYVYRQEERTLYFVNNRLIIGPGSLVVLENISGSIDCDSHQLNYCRDLACRSVSLLYD